MRIIFSLGIISTHSLTRRLTSVTPSRFLHFSISTHSLTRRLTSSPYYHLNSGYNFNSQPHKEADSICRRLRCTENISTHSLTRRLTGRPHGRYTADSHFNSQPHKEADCSGSYVRTDQNHFNSQPHKEADEVYSFPRITSIISTHSLTRRLTIFPGILIRVD